MMDTVKPDKITYTKVPLGPECKIEESDKTFVEVVMDSYLAALREGIEANSILINTNMVKVPSFVMPTPVGAFLQMPDMICGLHVYWTDKELPDGYSFAIMKGRSPEDRLAQFEAIGMEPDELRKAADLYRKIKEELG